jgi:hypothetical protein
MGLQDRDYWIEKYNKNVQYNPKEFRGSNIVKLNNNTSWKKYVLIFLATVFLLLDSTVQNNVAVNNIIKTTNQIYNNIPAAFNALLKGI